MKIEEEYNLKTQIVQPVGDKKGLCPTKAGVVMIFGYYVVRVVTLMKVFDLGGGDVEPPS